MTSAPDVFYITGGTLRSDAPCYVARRADRELYDGLSRGEFCYVLTARQMGKSSLMVRTAKRLRDGGAAVAVLDLTAVGQNLTAEQWYDGLLGHLGEQLDLESELEGFWLGHARLGPLERLMRALVDVALPALRRPVVIFIDEIDAVRSLPFSTDEFFAAIRECYNRRTADPELQRLTFCLLGVASPSDLIRDTRTTPFNIGQRVELDDFTEAEAAVLAQGLNREPEPASQVLRRILHWTRGHPYLTQRLCRSAAEDAAVRGPADVDRLCSRLFLSPRARERDDNLLFVRERILRSEVDRAALLDLYARVRGGRRVPDEETDPLVGVLRLSGVARAVEGRLRVRNPIYRRVFDADWVRTNMPDAEVRRQRRAFRRGLLRASVVAAVIMAAVGGLAWYAVQSQYDLKIQAAKLNASNLAKDELQKARDAAEDSAAKARKAEADLTTLERESRRLAVRYRVSTGMQLTSKGDLSGALVWFADPLDLEKDQPEREGLHRLRLEAALGQCPGLVRLWAHEGQGPVADAEFSADGARVISAGADKTARVWDVAGGDCVAVLRHEKPVIHAALSPDGRRALTLCKDDNVARVWDVRSQEVLFKCEHAGRVTCAVFDRAGDLAATASEDGTARVWDVDNHKAATPPLRHSAGKTPPADAGPRPGVEASLPVRSVAFDPDGKRVVTAGDDKTAQVWGVSEDVKAPLCRIPATGSLGRLLTQAVFSPDGRWVVTAGGPITYDNSTAPPANPLTDPLLPAPPPPLSSPFSGLDYLAHGGAAQVWYADSGQPESGELTHEGKVLRVAFDPFNRSVVTASDDRTAQVWRRQPPPADAPPPDTMFPQEDWSSSTYTFVALAPIKHTGAVHDIAFSPDGRYVVSASADGTARVWNARTYEPATPPLYHAGRVVSVSFDPEGRRVLTASEDGLVRLWELQPYSQVVRPYLGVWSPQQTSLSADGRRSALVDGEGVVWLADLSAGTTAPPLTPPAGAVAAWLSPDGQRLATMSGQKNLQFWDATTRKPTRLPVPVSKPVGFGVFSPDGRWLLATDQVMGASLWDADASQRAADLEPSVYVLSAAFSADGAMMALSVGDKVNLYETTKAAAGPIRTLVEPKSDSAAADASPYAGAVIFSPVRSDRLVVCGKNGAWLWDLKGDPQYRLLPHRDEVTAAAFSRDGRLVVTCSRDTTARIWDVETGKEVCDALAHDDEVSCAVFSPDGKRVATGSRDGTLRVWEADTGLLLTPPLKHTGGVVAVAFLPDDRLATATDRQQVQTWDLAPQRRVHRDDLMASVQLLSGQKLFARQDRLTPLDAVDFRGLWERRAGPNALREDSQWHLRQATAAEQDDDMEVALWHLERLRKTSQSPRLCARTANDLIQLSRPEPLDEAEKHLQEAEKYLQEAEDLLQPAEPAAAAPGLAWERAQLQLARGDNVARLAWMEKDDAKIESKRREACDAYRKCRELLLDMPDHVLTGRLTSDLVACYRDMGSRLADAGRLDAADACYRECWDMLREIPVDRSNLGPLKQNLADSFLNLGNSHRSAPFPTDEAVIAARDAYLKGLDVNESIAGEYAAAPDVLRQQFNLIHAAGNAYGYLKATDDALRFYERAIKVADRRAKTPTERDDARMDAAAVIEAIYQLYQGAGDNANAEKYCRMNVERAEAWVREAKTSSAARNKAAVANRDLGQLLEGKAAPEDDLKDVVPYYDRARELWEAAIANGGVDEDKSNLAEVCELLAGASLRRKDHKAFRTYSDENEQLLEELVKASAANDAYRQRLARAYEKQARTAEEDGAVAEARDCWRRAVGQREELLKFAASDDTSRALAEAGEQLAGLDAQAGDFRAALEHAGRAADVVKKGYDDAIDAAEVRPDLCQAYLKLGGIALRAGRIDRARAAYLDDLAVQEKGPRGDAAGVMWQSDLTAGNSGLAEVQLRFGDATEAVRLARRAVAGLQEPEDPGKWIARLLRDPGALDFPIEDPEQRGGELADAYRLLGAAQLAAGNADRARAAFGVGLRIHQSLENEAPRAASWRLGQAYDCEGLGRAAMRAEDYPTAAGWFRRGLAMLLRLDADGDLKDPDDQALAARLRRNLVFCENAPDALGDITPLLKRPRGEAVALLTLRAENLVLRHPTQDASDTAEALRGLAADGENLYATARCYAVMARAVARGRPKDDLSDDERNRWDDYVLKGVEALNGAVEHGFKDGRALRSDPDLDSLRLDMGYEDMLDSMDRASK